MKVLIQLQILAVEQSVESARRLYEDERSIWAEGDWRVQKTKMRYEHLSAALETLKGLMSQAA